MIVRYPEAIDNLQLKMSRAERNAGISLQTNPGTTDILYMLAELELKVGCNNSEDPKSLDAKVSSIFTSMSDIEGRLALVEDNVALRSAEDRITNIEANLSGFARTSVSNTFLADQTIAGMIKAERADFVYNPAQYDMGSVFAWGDPRATVRTTAFSKSLTSAWAIGQENEAIVMIAGTTTQPAFGLYNRAILPAVSTGSFSNVAVGSFNVAATASAVTITGSLVAELNQVTFYGATGATTNAFGQQVYVGLGLSSPATLTNAYGVYYYAIKTAQITNAFAIYQEGASDKNYFGGSVGIATTTPNFKLDVSGDIRIRSSSKLFIGGTGSGDADVNLYRHASDVLRTDDNVVVGLNLSVYGGGISVGQDSAALKTILAAGGQYAGDILLAGSPDDSTEGGDVFIRGGNGGGQFGNVVIGQASELSSSAAGGFLYIPTIGSGPSGTPISYDKRVPIAYSPTDKRLYLYDGGWKYVNMI